MMFLKHKPIFFVIMLLFVFQSCAEMKSWVTPKKHARTTTQVKRSSQTSKQVTTKTKTPALTKENEPAQSQTSSPTQASPQPESVADKYMKTGEYQKVINFYADACRKQPQDQSLAKEYAKSLNGMRSAADSVLGKGDTASAGRIYDILQCNYAKFNNVSSMLSFDKAYLNARLAYCKKTLSRQGFEEYRKGNINKAILLWQGLLAIDPNNKDIKRAVRTATQQQKNLQGKAGQ